MRQNQIALTKDPRSGILLTDVESGERIAFIEFDPSRMLIPRVNRDIVHVFVLNSIVCILKEPLYVKHAEATKKKSTLPADILEREADWFAGEINKDRSKVGNYTVTAVAVHASDSQGQP